MISRMKQIVSAIWADGLHPVEKWPPVGPGEDCGYSRVERLSHAKRACVVSTSVSVLAFGADPVCSQAH